MALNLSNKLPILDELSPPPPALAEPLADDVQSQEMKGVLRTSSYVIYVDLPGEPDDMLLVHSYAGTYDKVSRGVATYVRSLAARRPPKPLYGDWSPEPKIEGEVPIPSDQTIAVLRRRGYLTEMSPSEEEEFFEKFVNKLHELSARWMPSYMFMPTYNCNLRCSYCFQDHMRTDPRFGHLLRLMQPEVVDRLFAAMPEIERAHGLGGDEPRHRSIGLFGGEPLLAECRPIVGRIVQKANEIGTATFWAITNGTDLHAYEDLLAPGKLADLQITIDGPPAEHDKRRIYADGSGSFQRIAENISLALDHGVVVKMRINVDRHNIAQLPQLSEEISSRGWDKRPGFGAYVSPIRAENPSTDRKTTYNTWELDQALAEMAQDDPRLSVINRPDMGIKVQARKVFHDAVNAIPNFRESYCSAHTGLYIFDAFADMYACWDRTGDSNVRIGHVEEDGSVSMNHPVNAFWKGRTVVSNPVCRRCSYALFCGGGCAVLAYGKTGDYYSSHCDGFASRFRAAVATAYAEHLSGAAFVEQASRMMTE